MDSKGQKRALSLVASYGLGNGFLALAGTSDDKSYIVETAAKKARTLASFKSDVKINWCAHTPILPYVPYVQISSGAHVAHVLFHAGRAPRRTTTAMCTSWLIHCF